MGGYQPFAVDIQGGVVMDDDAYILGCPEPTQAQLDALPLVGPQIPRTSLLRSACEIKVITAPPVQPHVGYYPVSLVAKSRIYFELAD